MGFEQEIRKFIRRQFKSGNLRNLRKRVREFIKENGFEEAFKNDVQRLIKSVENDLFKAFKNDYLGGEAYQKRAEDALSAYANDNMEQIQNMTLYNLKYIDRRLIRDISKAIKEGLKGNLNWQDVARAALRKYKMRKNHVETEINTTQAALDRLARIEQIKQSGTKYIRYAGPTGTVRPFCVKHIGGVYRIDEIEGKLNRFRQPALYYMGGYNCRHRWVPMRGKEVYKQKNGQGRVFEEEGFKEKSKERLIAKLRAKRGFRVVLRDTRGPEGIKLADAWENGRPVEYKRITANEKTGAQNALRKGKEQAENILIFVDKKNIDFEELYYGILNALRNDMKNKIRTIIILLNDGTYKIMRRESIKDAQTIIPGN